MVAEGSDTSSNDEDEVMNELLMNLLFLFLMDECRCAGTGNSVFAEL